MVLRSMEVFVIMLRLLALEHLKRCSLQEYFSHPSLFIYFFPTTTGTANRWEGGRLLVANHLNQSLWSAKQKLGAAVRLSLLHFSLAGVRL
jgi:hypothetical protein